MNTIRKKRKFLICSILIVFILTFTYTIWSMEKDTKDTLQQKSEKTITKGNISLKNNITKEDIIEEAQRSLDRSIDILSMVATSIGVLVALFTLAIVVGSICGFFELKRWKRIRKNVEKDAQIIKNFRIKAEQYINKFRKEIENIPKPFTEKPSEETKEKFDDYGKRIEFLEAFGVPLKAEDYFARGTDFYYKGKYDLALIAIEKAIELKPDWSEAWNNKGIALYELKHYDKALKAYQKAIELKSNYAEAWNNKGNTLLELEKFDEAIKDYEKAIELKPDNAEAWSNKGVAFGKLNRLEEALKAHDKSIELRPDCARCWYNRACIYSLKSDKENTLANLSKAIKLDAKYKENAKKDEDFKNLWTDSEFKKITN